MPNSRHRLTQMAALAFILPFLVAGLYMMHLGFSMGMEAWRFKDGTLRAQGKIINFTLVQHHSIKTNRSCVVKYPVVSFPTPRMQDVRFVSTLGSCEPFYKKGDSVTVLYHPERPEHHAEIDDFWAFWFAPVLLSVMGFLVTGTSSTILALSYKGYRIRRT